MMTRPATKLLVVAASALVAVVAHAAGFVERQITVPLWGKVTVYRPEPIQETRGVVLFVSGDGGWNKGVVDMARRIAPRAIVAGLSMPAWQKAAEKQAGTCWYPAGELEEAAQAVEKSLELPRYIRPILVGYSSGATVVYGALAHAPDTTFAGAVSLGFCPDLEVARPICGRGEWKPSYDPKKHRSMLPVKPDLAPATGGGPRWIALQGEIDQVCDPPSTVKFVDQIPGAKIVSLPKVGHGFSVPRNWGTAFDRSVASLLEPQSPWEPLPEASRHTVPNVSPAELGSRLEALDLPLEVQWPEGAREAVIFVSGDGGWADLDQKVAANLVSRGVAVIGWNALRYFWEAKKPDAFLADLRRVVAAIPEGIRVFAGGYSFGAEVTCASLHEGRRSADDPLARIGGLVLLAPGPFATFEVSPLDWIRTDDSPTGHPVRSVLESGGGLPAICLSPATDSDSGCPATPGAGVRTVRIPGGHHFGGDFDGISRRVLDFMSDAADAGAGSTAPSPRS